MTENQRLKTKIKELEAMLSNANHAHNTALSSLKDAQAVIQKLTDEKDYAECLLTQVARVNEAYIDNQSQISELLKRNEALTTALANAFAKALISDNE